MQRYLTIGLAAAGFAALGTLPSFAAPAGEVAAPSEAQAVVEPKVARAPRRVLRRTASLRQLPPERPTELEAATPDATPGSAAAAEVASVGQPATTLRPTLDTAAQPDAPAAAVVSVNPPTRPVFRRDAAPTLATVEPEVEQSPAPPAPAPSLFGGLFAARTAPEPMLGAPNGRAQLDRLISQHAKLNAVPEALVHRIVVRESRYNPRAIGRGGAMGLMQIKTGTARALGYGGGPSGLLDAETNLTYAVKYLAGAYRVAGGDFDRAVGHYARGYYYAAKRQGVGQEGELRERRGRRRRGAEPSEIADASVAAPAPASEMRPIATGDVAAR